LDAASEARILEFLDTVTTVGIGPDVVRDSVGLRRKHKLNLPDAIIGATAIAIGAALITNDQKFLKVTEIRSRQVRIKQ
jgi:hypothetical protein